jgi:hypothetical protein
MENPESHIKTLRHDNAKKKFVRDLVFCKKTIIPIAKTAIAAIPTGME